MSNIFSKKCKYCRITDTITWHRDKWSPKKMGFYCHTCYNCISSKEHRGIVGLRWGDRRRGNSKVRKYQ